MFTRTYIDRRPSEGARPPARRFLRHSLAAVVAVLAVQAAPLAQASVTYVLDRSNIPEMPPGPWYLTVLIQDSSDGQPTGTVKFTVATTSVFDPIQLPNFGIQSFGFNLFNIGIPTDAQIGQPADWNVGYQPPGKLDGFGSFDVVIDTTGQGRLDPLEFTITQPGNSISSYADSNGTAWFAAHVTDFSTTTPEVTSAWFAGGGIDRNEPPRIVPLPPAVWLLGAGLMGLLGIGRGGRREVG